MTIVCVGDSTTSQEWCHPNWTDWLNFTFRQNDNWPEGWNRKLINSGKDGGTLFDFIEHFDREIGRFNPDVVIISLGFNHIELADRPGLLEKDARILFDKIKQTDAHIICWSTYDVPMPAHSRKLQVVSDLYRKLCTEYDATFIDIYAEFGKYDLSQIFTFVSPGNDDWTIKPGEFDYLHCNVIGNQIIADRIAVDGFKTKLSDDESFGTMKLLDLTRFLK
jgi:lysophospholipase L1-like esterase